MADDNEDGPNVRRVYGKKMEFGASIDIEAPPRDVQRAFGMNDSVELESELPGFKDGDYRPCDYCEGDSIVHVDDYEDHLQEKHNIEP